MTPSPMFLAESPLRTARRYADMDLKGAAQSGDIAWLHANPLMWLRALIRISRDIEVHIAKDRAGIAHLKPSGTGRTPPEWLAAKAGHDARTKGRMHFQQIVKTRIEEVKAILGPEPATGFLSVGDLIEVMEEIAEMADEGDLAAAADKARYHARLWAKRTKDRL